MHHQHNAHLQRARMYKLKEQGSILVYSPTAYQSPMVKQTFKHFNLYC